MDETSKRKISFVNPKAHPQTAYIELFTTLHWHLRHAHFVKAKSNSDSGIWSTDILFCLKKSDYAEKISNLTSTKNMTVGAKNNYAQAMKLDLTFLSFGFYIFEVFSSLLNSRRRLQDVQTETIRSERADNHLCRRALGMLNSKIKKWMPKG